MELLDGLLKRIHPSVLRRFSSRGYSITRTSSHASSDDRAAMQTPSDEASAAEHLKAPGEEKKVLRSNRETEAARKLIKAIIDDPSTRPQTMSR